MSSEKVIMPDGTARMIPTCKICDAPGRARLIEADKRAGRSSKAIAADMTENGWPIVADTINRHMKHATEPLPSGTRPKQLRDGVEFVKGSLLDALVAKQRRLKEEAKQHGEEYNDEFILDKDLQPALNTVLKAEGIKIKREEAQSKRQISLFMLMLGKNGGKAPTALIGDGTIEGEYRDVTPAEAQIRALGAGLYDDDGKEYDEEEDDEDEDSAAAD